MANEEINRKFDLVADHLANIAQTQMKADGRIDRLERMLTLAFRANQRERRETRDKINALVAAQTRIEEQHERDHRETQDKINALIDAQTRTEEKFGVLTTTMADLAQALTTTNKRIDGLESNGKK